MGDDHLDHADIDAEGHRSFGAQIGPPDRFARRASPLFSPHLAVVDQLLPVEVPDLLLPKIALQRGECRGLGSRRGGFPTSHISVI